MAIKAPAWIAAVKGIPTLKGWKHPARNEILLPKTFTQEEIDEYLGAKPAKKAAPKPAPVVEEVQEEAPVLVAEELEEAPEAPKVTAAAPKKSSKGKFSNTFGKKIKAAVDNAKDKI
jgi:hypothetical protein